MSRNKPWDNRKTSQVSSYIVRGHTSYLRSAIRFSKLRAKEKEKTPEYKSAMRTIAMGSIMLDFDRICKGTGFKRWVPHKPEAVNE